MRRHATYDELRLQQRVIKAVDRIARERNPRRDLSLGAKLTYEVLERRQRERRGNQACPVRAVAEGLGRSIRTAERYLAELRRAGLIRSIARYGARGIRIASQIILVRAPRPKKPHFNTPTDLSGSTRARSLSSPKGEGNPARRSVGRGGVSPLTHGHKAAAPGLRPGGVPMAQMPAVVNPTPPSIAPAQRLADSSARERDREPSWWTPEPPPLDEGRKAKLARWRRRVASDR